MKHTFRAMVALGIVTILAGCPPTTEPPTAEPPDTGPPAEQEAEEDWPRTFIDALDEEVTVQRPPQRVVSLSTGISEAIFAMGAGDRLVGRTRFVDSPPEALDVPVVGGMIDASLEAIVAQEPDLVLTVRGTPRDVVTSIRRTGVPVIAHDPTTVAEVIAMIRDVGRYLGVEKQAEDLARRLSERVAAVVQRAKQRAQRQGRPSLLFLIEPDPVFVAGEGHFVDDMIYLAGGVNAALLVEGVNGGQWPSLSLEAVVELDPDIIVTALENDDGQPIDGAEKLSKMAGWGELDAVRDGRVYTVDPDLAVRAGPRLIDALERMDEIVQDALNGGGGDGPGSP